MDHPARSRYPDYDVLGKWASPDWDDQTRAVVRRRLFEIPPICFFTERESRLLQAVAERILPQPERSAEQRIPIVPWIDAKLTEDRRDGYRYEGLPPQREAWRIGLAAIDQTSSLLYDGVPFTALTAADQDSVLRRIERGDPPGSLWRMLPAACFFTQVLCAAIVKTYYAHPTAWNETGYSGPSSPRGHMRIWEDGIDPWEPREGAKAGASPPERRRTGAAG